MLFELEPSRDPACALLVQSKCCLWRSREDGLENPRPHFSHEYGFAPVCTFMWNFSSYDCAKAFLHILQMHGLIFVCVLRTWLSCAAWDANAFPQCLHLNGRSPLCCLRCVRRIDDAVNALTQCGHWYGRSPLCTRWCLLKLLDCENRLPQTLHRCGRCFWCTCRMCILKRSRFSKERWHKWHGNLRSPWSTHRVYFRCLSL